MNGEPIHLLTKMGILTSFSISTKLTEKDINSMVRKLEKKGKDENEIAEIIRKNVMNDIFKASEKGTLPGLLFEESKFPIKNVEYLNNMVESLSSNLKNKKIDKCSMCYFINYLVSNLGLTEEDFEEFYRRISDDETY